MRASTWMAALLIAAATTTTTSSCTDTYGAAEEPLADAGASDSGDATSSSNDDSSFFDHVEASAEAADASDDHHGDADAGTTLGCNGKLDCERVVFVTHEAYGGDLGGSAGADAKCQLAADQSDRPRIVGRTFRAWLSTNPSNTAAIRHPHGIGKYVLVNDFLLALDWGDLVDGTIGGPINRDEKGNPIDDDFAWTGTSPNGDIAANDCFGFTATGPSGARGSTASATAGWTNVNTSGNCSMKLHLYCFEY